MKRSKFQSITHVDFSSRIQTVNKKINTKYWELINEFKQITGSGMVINTVLTSEVNLLCVRLMMRTDVL